MQYNKVQIAWRKTAWWNEIMSCKPTFQFAVNCCSCAFIVSSSYLRHDYKLSAIWILCKSCARLPKTEMNFGYMWIWPWNYVHFSWAISAQARSIIKSSASVWHFNITKIWHASIFMFGAVNTLKKTWNSIWGQ